MTDKRSNGRLFSFLLGGVVGVVLGLLYAPQSGEKTRQKLKETMEDLRDKCQSGCEELKRKIEEGKEKIEDVVDETKQIYAKKRGKKKLSETEFEKEV